MSTLSDLKSAQNFIIQNIFLITFAGVEVLPATINLALKPPSPTGSPSTISAEADAYAKASVQAGFVASDMQAVATRSLPQAWKGAVAETAAQAVQAVSKDINNAQSVLERASEALRKWADDLQWAQSADQLGRSLLNEARNAMGFIESLSSMGFSGVGSLVSQVLQKAIDGVNARVAAAQRAQDTGTSTASLLNQLAAQARAERVSTATMDPLSAVVLATEANPGGSVDGGDILSESALARASQRLGALSTADQAAFQKLVSGSLSPQEAAYLWKALAAGHSVAQIQQFDATIHSHGADPNWLAGHLTPDLTNAGSQTQTSGANMLTYQGKPFSTLDKQGYDVYDQGNVGDCVAAATVIAQASVDPVTMLDLTTGGKPNGNDSPAAFHQRLQQMYVSQYIEGQKADGQKNTYPTADTGLGPTAQNLLANQDLGNSTGSPYHHVFLNSTDDRQNALPSIEQAVDSGKPVPLDVASSSEGHQMMIIARDGDKLEVYNPWGYTSWITESQFANNQLGSLTTTGGNGSMQTASGLELPQ